ncbi:MAG TPA: hypothetical protein VEP90_24005 [Methylomirabilota bacterium]|nr:hypothetical protein [Methylomirabilota bacterium]
MTETGDLIKNLVDQKPNEFASTFDQLVKDRISQKVADTKVQLSSTLFGSPEAVDDEQNQETEDDDATGGNQETETDSN